MNLVTTYTFKELLNKIEGGVSVTIDDETYLQDVNVDDFTIECQIDRRYKIVSCGDDIETPRVTYADDIIIENVSVHQVIDPEGEIMTLTKDELSILETELKKEIYLTIEICEW